MLWDLNIEDLDKNNPMSLFYEFGFDPEDIKSSILDSFDKYFSNKTNLEKHAINALVSTWILYLTSRRINHNSIELLDKTLAIFQKAKNKNPEKAFQAYSQWFPLLFQALSRYWTLYKSQSELEDLILEDFLEETLRQIGQSIEGISKPFLKMLLHMSRIRRNKVTTFESINELKLGVVVSELIEMEDLEDLLIISPLSIKVNQWRNISYHHNSKILKNKIFCWFAQKEKKVEFEIKREELSEILSVITNINRILKIAETLFCIDNLEEIEGHVDRKGDQLNIRYETKLLDFYAPISSQGFEVVSLDSTKKQAVLIVRDMMRYPDLKLRALHSSQFLYHLWLYSSSKTLKVEYHTFDSEKFLTSEISSSSFEKNKNSDIKFSKLMEDVEFTFISLEMTQNKNPFENLKLPKSLNEMDQNFFSQEGDLLSLNEFIRKFTLNVFTNYLVFRSENFDGKSIRISVGSDGAITIGEDLRGTFLLHVPANIKNKVLQKFIIEVLHRTISLYNRKELEVAIVEEALNKNRFFFKKGLIKDQMQTNRKSQEKI